MPSFSVDDFKAAIGTPARSHSFRCTITAPSIVTSHFTPDASYLCKATTLPSATVETTELSYFSRAVKIPGKRTYAPITLTFYASENYELRGGFEKWSSALNAYADNQRSTNPFFSTINLVHYSIGVQPVNNPTTNQVTYPSIVLATYTLKDAFPTTVSGLQFNYDSDAEIQTFDVEFQYQYFTVEVKGTVPVTANGTVI